MSDVKNDSETSKFMQAQKNFHEEKLIIQWMN
jgi:hypothetical protein